MKRFKMKDLGVLSWFLGIQFRCERECIKMNQNQYVERILSKIKMLDCKPKAVPCDSGANKACETNGSEFENANLYREIAGSLIYLMTCTRPDLCYVLTYLPQHLSKPLKTHYGMAKQVLRYLKGTPCRPLRFIKGSQPKPRSQHYKGVPLHKTCRMKLNITITLINKISATKLLMVLIVTSSTDHNNT